MDYEDNWQKVIKSQWESKFQAEPPKNLFPSPPPSTSSGASYGRSPCSVGSISGQSTSSYGEYNADDVDNASMGNLDDIKKHWEHRMIADDDSLKSTPTSKSTASITPPPHPTNQIAPPPPRPNMSPQSFITPIIVASEKNRVKNDISRDMRQLELREQQLKDERLVRSRRKHDSDQRQQPMEKSTRQAHFAVQENLNTNNNNIVKTSPSKAGIPKSGTRTYVEKDILEQKRREHEITTQKKHRQPTTDAGNSIEVTNFQSPLSPNSSAKPTANSPTCDRILSEMRETAAREAELRNRWTVRAGADIPTNYKCNADQYVDTPRPLYENKSVTLNSVDKLGSSSQKCDLVTRPVRYMAGNPVEMALSAINEKSPPQEPRIVKKLSFASTGSPKKTVSSFPAPTGSTEKGGESLAERTRRLSSLKVRNEIEKDHKRELNHNAV